MSSQLRIKIQMARIQKYRVLFFVWRGKLVFIKIGRVIIPIKKLNADIAITFPVLITADITI